MSHWAAGLFATGLEAITKGKSRNQGALACALSSVARYPIKAIAAFLLAPVLAFRLALLAKNPTRRLIASVGLVISILLAWVAGTFFGTIAGALFIGAQFGWLTGVGLLIGTWVSVTLSAVFSILVLNTASWFFLNISSEEVIAYLKSISE